MAAKNGGKTGSDPSRETGVIVDVALTLREKGLTLFFPVFPRVIRGYKWIDLVGVAGLQKHSLRYRAVPYAIS